jgi:hypothetical protein
MKKATIFLIIILLATAATLFLNKLKAQENFTTQCEPRFNAVSVFYSVPGNFGLEFTRWATSTKFSYGFSMHMIRTEESYVDPISKRDTSRNFYTAAAHLHTMYRINRYLHPILSVGIKELDQFEAFVGLRSVIPLFNGVTAFWFEPSYGTMGGQFRVAFSYALGASPRRRMP